MAIRLEFDGLEELKAELRNLPHALKGEAAHLIEAAGNSAAVQIRTNYGRHRKTGNLQDHVVVDHTESEFGAGALVKSTARHAFIFEYGTVARHYVTENGVTHRTGAMPPFRAFVPVMQQVRRGMYESLKRLLQDHGLIATGEP